MQNAYGALLRLDPRRYLPVVTAALRGRDERFPSRRAPRPPARGIRRGPPRSPWASPASPRPCRSSRRRSPQARARSSQRAHVAIARCSAPTRPSRCSSRGWRRGRAARPSRRSRRSRCTATIPKIAERARRSVEERGSPRLDAALKEHAGLSSPERGSGGGAPVVSRAPRVDEALFPRAPPRWRRRPGRSVRERAEPGDARIGPGVHRRIPVRHGLPRARDEGTPRSSSSAGARCRARGSAATRARRTPAAA